MAIIIDCTVVSLIITFHVTTSGNEDAWYVHWQIAAFDYMFEDWSIFVEWAEQFMKANKVDNDHRVVTLLSLMGSATCSLFQNVVAPKKPSELPCNDIVSTL